jgi:hypothetical protein
MLTRWVLSTYRERGVLAVASRRTPARPAAACSRRSCSRNLLVVRGRAGWVLTVAVRLRGRIARGLTCTRAANFTGFRVGWLGTGRACAVRHRADLLAFGRSPSQRAAPGASRGWCVRSQSAFLAGRVRADPSTCPTGASGPATFHAARRISIRAVEDGLGRGGAAAAARGGCCGGDRSVLSLARCGALPLQPGLTDFRSRTIGGGCGPPSMGGFGFRPRRCRQGRLAQVRVVTGWCKLRSKGVVRLLVVEGRCYECRSGP